MTDLSLVQVLIVFGVALGAWFAWISVRILFSIGRAEHEIRRDEREGRIPPPPDKGPLG